MASFQINSREIRSFKLYKQTLELRTFFEEKNRNGIFMMCDSLHPTERILMRADLAKNNLKINIVPKNITKFLFKTKETNNIKNLLSGSVVLIRDTNNNALTEEQIKFLFKQEKMSIRFLFWNHQIYRGSVLEKYISLKSDEKDKKVALITLTKPINNLLNVYLPFTLKSNYINV